MRAKFLEIAVPPLDTKDFFSFIHLKWKSSENFCCSFSHLLKYRTIYQTYFNLSMGLRVMPWIFIVTTCWTESLMPQACENVTFCGPVLMASGDCIFKVWWLFKVMPFLLLFLLLVFLPREVAPFPFNFLFPDYSELRNQRVDHKNW